MSIKMIKGPYKGRSGQVIHYQIFPEGDATVIVCLSSGEFITSTLDCITRI